MQRRDLSMLCILLLLYVAAGYRGRHSVRTQTPSIQPNYHNAPALRPPRRGRRDLEGIIQGDSFEIQSRRALEEWAGEERSKRMPVIAGTWHLSEVRLE